MKPLTLLARKTLYESFLDNMLDGLAYCQMIFDAQERPIDWIYIEVNKNFEKLAGLKEPRGKKVTELIPGINASNPELFEIYGRVALGGKPEKFETYVEPLSRWFLVSVYCPKKSFFMAIFQDITDRKQVEKDLENAKLAARNVLDDLQLEKEELAQAKAKDEAMLASIGDAMIATDQNAKVIFMNEAIEKLVGWKKDEIIGKSWFEVVPMEDEKGNTIPDDKRPINIAMSPRKTTTTTTTYYFVRKDKTRFPVAITVTPIILNGQTTGAIEIFRDISKEKEVEKLKDDFVSMASHELRTPMTAIKGFISMIMDGDFGPVNDHLKEPLKDVAEANERLIHLVNDLLSVSRIEAGRFKFNLSVFPYPVDKIIKNVCQMFRPLAQEKRLKLNISKVSKSLFEAEEDKVREILNNLVGNALKFTDKGHVTLSSKEEGDLIIIEIADTGIGIAREDQQKLFRKFEQISTPQTGRSRGTGLGLYISREIARKMGGDVWLEKSEPGKGSAFAFSIPIAKSALANRTRAAISKERAAHLAQK